MMDLKIKLMKNYFDLLKKLAPLDRCHCGPEMEEAYQILVIINRQD